MNVIKGMAKLSLIPLDVTEKVLTQLYRERVFLKLVTLSMDQQLKFQEKTQKRIARLLRFLKIPVAQDMEQINLSLIKLEKEFEKQKRELDQLKAKTEIKPSSRRSRKKSPMIQVERLAN